MLKLLKTTVGGYTFEIIQDDCAESPRAWGENFCQLIFTGQYSHLGDIQPHDLIGDFLTDQRMLKRKYDAAIVVPVYAYIHSGMTISLEPFSCPWDSGQLGWAIVTKEQIRYDFGGKNMTKTKLEKAHKILEGEIKTLDQLLRGEVYGFTVTYVDEVIDSCWGFFGDDFRANGLYEELFGTIDLYEELFGTINLSDEQKKQIREELSF